jgi:hypothetical protein
MNSRIEPKFRDSDDARGKLVGLTSGAGFRLLVKQALAPGEPLQIDIGDGNLLVLARYRLPGELGHSFGAEGIAGGINDRRRGDTAISSEEAPGQDASGLAGGPHVPEDRGSLRTAAVRDSSSKQSSAGDRRGPVLGGIAAAIALSALGILWGGIRGEHAIAPLPAFATPTKTPPIKKTPETTATNSIDSPGHAGPTALSFPETNPETKSTDEARVKAVPRETVSAPPALHPKATAGSGAGAVNSISIKASNASWVTACADGVKVLGRLFNNGESGEVRFSNRAEVHSGNAGAIELTIGDRSIGPMGKWGQMRTINATPAGYEFVTTMPAPNCSETSPEN